MFMKSISSTLLALLFFTLASICRSDETSSSSNTTTFQGNKPKVVVSITPFYTLVAAVMEGVGNPQLLVKPGASPHDYALKASDIQLLQEADLLFWGGPALETFLIKPIANLFQDRPGSLIVELDKAPGLLLLPVRQGPTWETHAHQPHEEATHPHLDPEATLAEGDVDMHFWLDPNNALILTDNIAKNLATLDPTHANQYYQNADLFKSRLKKLDNDIARKLKSIRTIPYITFHDAYQYFERHYGLNGVGAITLHPELPPSAKRLETIRSTIQRTKAHCVFTEPQFQPKLVLSIVQDLPVNSGELNPEGQVSQKNPNGYFELLENLSNAMTECLNNSNPKINP